MAAPSLQNAVTSLNGKLYSFGGYSNGRTADSYVYDPDANAWSAIAPLPSVRESASAVTDGNLIYIIGGLDSAGLTSTIYSYDPTNNTYDTGLAHFSVPCCRPRTAHSKARCASRRFSFSSPSHRSM